MNARLNVFENKVLGKTFKHLIASNKALLDSTLPHATQELVKIRASQINGCAMCLDMHTKDALAAGEDQTRLNMVAAWREATVFTGAERVALELAEVGTRIADGAGGVSDELWDEVVKHYDEEQQGALIGLIALINAFNRGNLLVKQPAGDYTPGMFD